jgi:hypothetical protein
MAHELRIASKSDLRKQQPLYSIERDGQSIHASSNQPKAPTDCDKYWWAQYK